MCSKSSTYLTIIGNWGPSGWQQGNKEIRWILFPTQPFFSCRHRSLSVLPAGEKLFLHSLICRIQQGSPNLSSPVPDKWYPFTTESDHNDYCHRWYRWVGICGEREIKRLPNGISILYTGTLQRKKSGINTSSGDIQRHLVFLWIQNILWS